VFVKIDKSEYFCLISSLVLDKICPVLLDMILFIERIIKIEDNKSILCKVALNTNSLLVSV
jgi:hypothetical protein